MLSHLWTNVAYLRPNLHSCNIFLIFFQVLSMMMMTTTPPDFQGLISSRPWLKWKSFNENWVSNFFSESGFCWISQLQFPNINPWESHDGIEIGVYAFSCQDFYSNLERYFLILSRSRSTLILRTWRSGSEWFLRYSVCGSDPWLCFIPMYSQPISIICHLPLPSSSHPHDEDVLAIIHYSQQLNDINWKLWNSWL